MDMALPLVRMPLLAVCSSRILAPPPGLETSLNLTEDDPIMTIPPECEAQILRYFHVEKWPPTTIARQLNINVNGGQDRYRMRRWVSRLPGLTVGVVMDRV